MRSSWRSEAPGSYSAQGLLLDSNRLAPKTLIAGGAVRVTTPIGMRSDVIRLI